MNSKCKICNKKIRDNEKKVILWEKMGDNLSIVFCHTKCVPQEAEDITKETIGPKYSYGE